MPAVGRPRHWAYRTAFAAGRMAGTAYRMYKSPVGQIVARSLKRRASTQMGGVVKRRRITPNYFQWRSGVMQVRNLRRTRTRAIERRRRRPALYGATSSKSAGFIQTKQKVKYRGRLRSTNLGVVDVIETGGVLDAGVNTATAGNTVAVGHCQFPPGLAHKMFWRAVIKKLAVMCKMNVYNFEAGVSFNTGAMFQAFYRKGPESGLVPHTFTCSGTHSLEAVATDFFNHFEMLDDAEDLELFSICFYDKVTALGQFTNFSNGLIKLDNATFTIFSKSTLKVQNRTVNQTGGDEESVDNVPLYGKAFYGKGSGTSAITADQTYSGGAASGFWCDASNGTMAKVPLEKWYQEIPQASHFRHVLTTGKVHLDPGHIKTSVLDGKVTISVNKLYRILFRTDSAVNNHSKAILGRFRFMMLEKMLTSVTGEAANSIKCAFEHNIRIGGYITLKRSTETAQLNSVYNLDNEI